MHAPGCIRSDGEWFCARGCTHEKDEKHARIVNENTTMRRVLKEIAQGHPNPVLHAQSTLSSLNSEE